MLPCEDSIAGLGIEPRAEEKVRGIVRLGDPALVIEANDAFSEHARECCVAILDGPALCLGP